MDLSSHIMEQINRFMFKEYGMEPGSLRVVDKTIEKSESVLFLHRIHKQYPALIRLLASHNGSAPKIIPYHVIGEKRNRQIASYWIGKGISNLAEVREWSGCLYSRYAPSYEPHELAHSDANESKMGLWIHDCLSEDFDHHPEINRATLPGGAVVSYDFGMSFSHPYFPPFYTFELSIGDEAIINNRRFLIGLLSEYAQKRLTSEAEYLGSLNRTFPSIINPDVCRYYFRNFQAYFFKRVRLSRLFEKIRQVPFSAHDVNGLLQLLDIGPEKIGSWDDIQKKLLELSKNALDLQGLNLSGADLRKARLMGANLRDVNFQGADLRQANLTGADITGADFRDADLRGARIDSMGMK
jgi:hypothetical protein